MLALPWVGSKTVNRSIRIFGVGVLGADVGLAENSVGVGKMAKAIKTVKTIDMKYFRCKLIPPFPQ